MSEHERKEQKEEQPEREETMKDLDVPKEQGEDVKGGTTTDAFGNET